MNTHNQRGDKWQLIVIAVLTFIFMVLVGSDWAGLVNRDVPTSPMTVTQWQEPEMDACIEVQHQTYAARTWEEAKRNCLGELDKERG